MPSLEQIQLLRNFPVRMNDAKLSPDQRWLACVGDTDALFLVPVTTNPDDGTLSFGEERHRISLRTDHGLHRLAVAVDDRLTPRLPCLTLSGATRGRSQPAVKVHRWSAFDLVAVCRLERVVFSRGLHRGPSHDHGRRGRIKSPDLPSHCRWMYAGRPTQPRRLVEGGLTRKGGVLLLFCCRIPSSPVPSFAVAFSPVQENLLVVGIRNSLVLVVDVATAMHQHINILSLFPVPAFHNARATLVNGVCFSPDGLNLYVGMHRLRDACVPRLGSELTGGQRGDRSHRTLSGTNRGIARFRTLLMPSLRALCLEQIRGHAGGVPLPEEEIRESLPIDLVEQALVPYPVHGQPSSTDGPAAPIVGTPQFIRLSQLIQPPAGNGPPSGTA